MFTPEEKKTILILCFIFLLAGLLRLVNFTDNFLPEYNEQKIIIVNINSAEIDKLVELPGIGPKTAEKIIEYRSKYGLFLSIDDLENVKGLGPKKIENIKEFITF